MSLAFFTVDTDRFHYPKSFIVRVYHEDELVNTTNFPIGNPNLTNRTKNQACEFGRLSVKKIIDGVMQ